jgi:hypothetical protein
MSTPPPVGGAGALGGAWTPVQRGSFAWSASSQGPEMSTWVLSVSVVSVVPVEDAGSVEVPSDGPTAATTTAAKIPRSATERVNVIAFRMEGRMRDVPPAAAQAPVRAR